MAIELTILNCALDDEGLRLQRERYARVARDVSSLTRSAGVIRVVLETGFDSALLEEAIAVERECCPFFEIDLDEARAIVTVSVRDPELRPALDTIAQQLAPADGG
jgi:hypothetical protein